MEGLSANARTVTMKRNTNAFLDTLHQVTVLAHEGRNTRREVRLL